MGDAAFGTILTKGTTTPITIGKLNNIGGVELSADWQDTTTHDSADGYREGVPTLLSAGEVPIAGEMISSDTGQAALLTAFNSKASDTFEITYPTGDKWSFTAYVTRVKMADAPVDGKLPFEATLKITGKPVFTPAP